MKQLNENSASVAVAILNWNGKKFLETLLPQLYKLSYAKYKIYVIDNSSSDDSVQYLKHYHADVKLIELTKNYGFAGGYNRGFTLMEEDYFLMLNSDVEVPENVLEVMVTMMESDSSIAVCQNKILSLTNKKMYEHAGAAGGMIDFLGYPFCRGRIFDVCEEDHNQYESVAEIFWAAGACCLIRKSAFRKVGGMYEYFFMHSEEIDMCWRMIADGYKIMYCPDSFIYHLGGGSLPYSSSRKIYYNFRNNLVMCFRNSPWYTNLWWLPARFFLDLLSAFTFLIDGNKSGCKAVMEAYGSFIKWMIHEKNKYPDKKKSLASIRPVLKKSVVWLFFVMKKKTYSDMK